MADMPDWARAHGAPLFDARIRQCPEDFVVDELLGFEPSGDGEHDLVKLRKTSANTAWVARRLAAFAGIPARDVGYCGLKDRHAVTTQWFSVRRTGTNNWDAFEAEGVEILDVQPHRRKLRRGTHRGNAFRIVLRAHGGLPAPAVIDDRLKQIGQGGVPNYFGEQRFGHGGSNIGLAERVFKGERMKRDRRSIAISAARALLFNAILDARVRGDNWNRVVEGDLVNLDGSSTVFAYDGEDLAERLEGQDVHPTATLWGTGAPLGTSDAADIEVAAVRGHASLCEGLTSMRMDAASRPLRLRVRDIRCEVKPDAVSVQFELGKGGYATSVLREIARWQTQAERPGGAAS